MRPEKGYGAPREQRIEYSVVEKFLKIFSIGKNGVNMDEVVAAFCVPFVSQVPLRTLKAAVVAASKY